MCIQAYNDIAVRACVRACATFCAMNPSIEFDSYIFKCVYGCMSLYVWPMYCMLQKD